MSNDAIDLDSLDLNPAGFRSSEDVRNAVFDLANKEDVEAKYSIVEDLAIFEGDIILGTVAEVEEQYKKWLAGAKGVVRTGQQFRWPSEKIAYVTQDALKQRVTKAIAHWEEKTPFRFIARTNEADYISFEDRGGCASAVGRQGGKQIISLGAGCTVGNAIHEIGHALGLWHEQSREDRDAYVTIQYANINAAFVHNFDQHISDGDDVGAYDFGSIMHYPKDAFSKNGQDTIVTKDGQSIGQRTGLSEGDIAAIKSIYGNLNWP